MRSLINHSTLGGNSMNVKRVFQICLILILALSSLAATATPAHALSSCGGSYVVQRSDWLAKIARNCGVSLADLQAANNWIYYYNYIYPGQVLTIPGAYDGGGPGTGSSGFCGPTGSYYVVCPRDTLASIGRYYGVSWTYLQWRNSI